MPTTFTAEELAQWSQGVWDPIGPRLIRGVTQDSRRIAHGDLYVALRGRRWDGHAFVEAAFAAGAAAAMVEDRAPLRGSPDRPLLRVADTAQALRALARGHRARLTSRIIAITGSAGKTTVKEWLLAMLSTSGAAAGTVGNWNNEIGLPLSLLAMPIESRWGVFEVAMNHPGELRPLCELLRPEASLITNVGPVHIEFFASEEAIAREKAEVLRALPPSGLAVLHLDGGWFELLRSMAPGPVMTVGHGPEADFRWLRYDPQAGTAEVVEKASGQRRQIRPPRPGHHQVVNALLAAAMARAHGVAWDQIEAALARLAQSSLPGRWEQRHVAGLQIIHDAYNANPLSMRAALRAFADWPCAADKWLVLGGMLELGRHAEAEHLALGTVVAAGPWAGLVTVGSLGEWIALGARRAGWPHEKIVVCADKSQAAAALRERARPGSAVLLKASRGIGLEDVLRWLENGAPAEAPPTA